SQLFQAFSYAPALGVEVQFVGFGLGLPLQFPLCGFEQRTMHDLELLIERLYLGAEPLDQLLVSGCGSAVHPHACSDFCAKPKFLPFSQTPGRPTGMETCRKFIARPLFWLD